MQMFLFTPIVIIPLALKPIVGLIGKLLRIFFILKSIFSVAAVIFIISTATNIFLVYYYHWPVRGFFNLLNKYIHCQSGQNWFHPTDPEQTNIE